jgi:hypothetical protein
MGVVIGFFHAMYTLTQKRLKVIVSTDKAIMMSKKYAKWWSRMSSRDIRKKRKSEPLGGDRTQNVNTVGTAAHE